MRRACILHEMIDEFRGEVRYKPKVFIENETEGRGYFQQPWSALSSRLKRWGLSDAEIAAFKTRIDKHQHATQSVEVEETRLWELALQTGGHRLMIIDFTRSAIMQVHARARPAATR